ncbi:hypothetical protein [Gracilinema caldarium]|uniref:Lipoprotein n=1 Tax=Gracilinema caldarium (strain ATCC 51460 / DSM 7334 / H1) TaxID=744872 RepID=F8EXK1_GRAC1|nr:hypothetical protein [Gracilinema caldarium]AEJ19582.1 putative lipoprotein [Gracilinema caldarium DSM 7334]
MKRIVWVFIVLSVSLSSLSCFLANPEQQLHPPVTFLLSRSVIGYVVITNSYTQLLDHYGRKGVSLGVLRKGTILPVLERRILQDGESTTERWILVSGEEKGWIRESSGKMYQTQAQAQTALKNLLQGQQ